ncbi:MAG: Crp/Fnr family transcriptional regulator [Bauldia sp.]
MASSDVAIREAERRIEDQRSLVAHLSGTGRDTSRADRALADMEAAFATIRDRHDGLWPLRAFVRNRLLRLLREDDFRLIAGDLKPASLALREVLSEPHMPIEMVTFVDRGLVSAVAGSGSGTVLEFGIIGNDGVVGYPLAMGVDRTPYRYLVQVPGEGWTMPAAALSEAMRRTSIRELLLRYAYLFHLQTVETAFANATQTVEKRLARWLLLYDDRSDGGEFRITHDFLAQMLGVRRASVTVALHLLEGEQLIRARRQSITIRRRAGLEALAADCYGAAEAEAARLLRTEGNGAARLPE